MSIDGLSARYGLGTYWVRGDCCEGVVVHPMYPLGQWVSVQSVVVVSFERRGLRVRVVCQ